MLPAELQYFGTNKYCSLYSLLPLGRAGLRRSYKLKELNDCFHTDLSLHVEKGGRNFCLKQESVIPNHPLPAVPVHCSVVSNRRKPINTLWPCLVILT